MFDRLLDKITKAYNYFNQLGHLENVVASLSTKFEILHYLKDFENANKILVELQNIIETYDLDEQKRKLEILVDHGTTHEKFKVLMNRIFGEADAKKKEYEEERKEMIRMDEEERKIKDKPNEDNLHIHLFPLGHFQFPEKKRNNVYEILKINQDARKIFDNMFETVIPVANIYYNPITQEGFVDGELAEKGIESWKHIYKIRKAFHENKYYRIENI